MSPRIALVMSGGGARGPYEIGVLSVLMPELERRGERPSIVVGTSVGAFNAAFVAANDLALRQGRSEFSQSPWSDRALRIRAQCEDLQLRDFCDVSKPLIAHLRTHKR